MTDNATSPAGPRPAGPASLSELLAGAVRPDAADTTGERAALAAFRAARDSGVHTASGAPRRRDDWRPRRRRAHWSVRATVGALLASLAVGGVAVAGIGAGRGEPSSGRPEHAPRPASTAPPAPARTPSAPPSSTARPGHGHGPGVGHGRDREARCTSYEKGRGLNRSLRAAEGCGTPTATPPGKDKGRDNGHRERGGK